MYLDDCLSHSYPFDRSCYESPQYPNFAIEPDLTQTYKELKFKKVLALPLKPEANTIYFLLNPSTGDVSCFITESKSERLFNIGGGMNDSSPFTPENYYLARNGM